MATSKTTTTEKKYKWEHPVEWLHQYLASLGPVDLLQEARNLASKLDGDEIQDIYQSDMAAQGYFTPELEATEYTVTDPDQETTCDNCGAPLYVGDTAFEVEDEGHHVYCSEECAQEVSA